MKPGRNDPCACGSGKKFKNCCLKKPDSYPPSDYPYLNMLFSDGRYAELEICARKLLDRHPDAGPIWKMYGLSLQMQGKDSLSALIKAAKLLPDDAEAHANLAGAFRSVDMLTEALEESNLALQIKPDFAEAYNNLGLVLKDLGRLDDAISKFRNALQLKPGFIQAQVNLGGALKSLGELGEAEECFRRAIQIHPGYLHAYTNLAAVFNEAGKTEDAKNCYRTALEIDPENYEILLALGAVHIESGETSEAENLFRQALRIDPDNIDALCMLTEIKTVKAGDNNMAALIAAEQSAANNHIQIPLPQLISLNFTLGKCFDDLTEPDKAFPYFLKGCQLKRASIEYDSAQISKQFDAIIKVFNNETIDRLHGGGSSSKVPIFVLGMPRSGTTLTEQIIASHPEVYGAGELPDLHKIAHRNAAGENSYPENVIELDHPDLSRLADDYIASLCRRAPDARRITDKMPENFRFIGLIHLMLPNAKIIHIQRNPVDTCLSSFTKLFRAGLAYTYDLDELGRYYVDYARLMEHWRHVLPPGSFLDVRYEEIVEDIEKQARRIIDFCDLDWNDACINFHKSKRSIQTSSHAQVRRPIYKSAVERWRPYEKHLGPLMDALGDLSHKSGQ